MALACLGKFFRFKEMTSFFILDLLLTYLEEDFLPNWDQAAEFE